MNKDLLIGTIIFTVGITGALTSFLIIDSPFLTAVFLSWVVVGLVYVSILSRGLGGGLNPLLILEAYETSITHLLEEFGLYDIEPFFVPSKYSKEPVMIIPSSGEFKFSPVPRRLIIYGEGEYALRVETFGTAISRKLGDISGGDISAAENTLKLILVNDMNLADDIIVSESSAGDEIAVEISRPVLKHKEELVVAANIYLQIVGTIISETIQKIIRLIKFESGNKQLTFKFLIVGE